MKGGRGRNQDRTYAPGRGLWKMKGSRSLGRPFSSGWSVRTEKEFQRLSETGSSQHTQQPDLHRWSVPPPHALQTETHTDSACGRWMLDAGCWDSGFSGQTREKTGTGCMETAWRGWSLALGSQWAWHCHWNLLVGTCLVVQRLRLHPSVQRGQVCLIPGQGTKIPCTLQSKN